MHPTALVADIINQRITFVSVAAPDLSQRRRRAIAGDLPASAAWRVDRTGRVHTIVTS
jgi:hypothetical protein